MLLWGTDERHVEVIETGLTNGQMRVKLLDGEHEGDTPLVPEDTPFTSD